MGKTGSERVEVKIPWLLVIVLSTFLGFLGTVWYSFLPFPFFATNSLGIVLCGPEFIGTPFFIIIVFLAVQALAVKSSFLKKKASSITLAYLYIIGVGVGYFINQQYPGCMLMRHLSLRVSNPTIAEWLLPEFMAPQAELVNQIITGTASIPWIDWIPFISFWSILHILFAFYFISIASIFRRQWIELEKVPFPHTMPAYQLIRVVSAQTTESRVPSLTKLFTIGIIIGLLVQMPITFVAIFPWFPDIYGWRVNTCATGGWWVPPGHPLASIAGLSILNKHPMVWALSYFAPLNILLSSLIFWIINIIIVQVAYIMGYYTGIESIGGCGRGWCTPSPLRDPPLRLFCVSHVGGLIGFALFYLILTRKYVINTIKAALGKGELRKMENEEPIPYRIAYITTIISFILISVLFMLCGISLFAAILIPISAFIFWFAQVRLVGIVGVPTRANQFGSFFHRWLIWPDVPTPMTRDCALATHFARNWGADTPSDGWPGLWTGFMSYRMASLTGVSSKNAFKVLLTSTIIAAIMTHITFVWVGYMFGVSKLPAISGYIGFDMYFACYTPEGVNRFPSPGNPVEWMPNVLVGIVAVGLLSFIHAKFIWFPLDPIGFIMAFSLDGYQWGMALPFFVAWVAKTLTLRIGGSKAYEEYGAPVAGGIVVGCLIASLIGGVMMIVRFFYPY
ncbi:MAG: DUF6785 family protein [Candidatus Bathyarchaeia archaeon]